MAPKMGRRHCKDRYPYRTFHDVVNRHHELTTPDAYPASTATGSRADRALFRQFLPPVKRRRDGITPQEKFSQVRGSTLARRNRCNFKDVVEVPEGSNRKRERGIAVAIVLDHDLFT